MPKIGRDVGVGVSGIGVATSREENRLKREVKLERLDLELSARNGVSFTGGGVVGICCPADVIEEDRGVSSGSSSEFDDFLFVCFSVHKS
jgi:hypothetical protein